MTRWDYEREEEELWNSDCCGCCVFCMILGWAVMWILLYGYVIFPHIATEKNTMLLCNPVIGENGQREQQHHYNEQTETYETYENIECELSVNVWLWGVPAGIASAFFSFLLLCPIGRFLMFKLIHILRYILGVRIIIIDQEVEMDGENNL